MTAQIHELLIFNGEETSMACCPDLPDKHPRIYAPSSNEIEAEGGTYVFMDTSCWRNYQGTWEINNGRFYLVSLSGNLRMRGNEPIFADWFSGDLCIPKGKMLRYIHMGFDSTFEQEVHVKIEKGIVVTSHVIDNRGKT